MSSNESQNSDRAARVVTRNIHHVAVDGEGSATIVEFHCDGECHRLLITVKGRSVSAQWIEPGPVNRVPFDTGSGEDDDSPSFTDRD